MKTALECKFGHFHPPKPVTIAIRSPNLPYGPRPVHCLDCQYVNHGGRNPSHWESYRKPKQTQEAFTMTHGVHNDRDLCKKCFPRGGMSRMGGG